MIVLDCGTGVRQLGLDLMQRGARYRIHLLIGHTHWDHIQGFPFFIPAFVPGTELDIYAPAGFQQSLRDSMSGQMQYSYFPVKLNDLLSRIHYHELEEGFFRIGDVLVETQYLNHTAPTLAYRISKANTTMVYVTDHESYWDASDGSFRHPGDQRHIAFLQNADLVIHDAQYTHEEYKTKMGWGHSSVDYAVDVAMASGASRLALFHHDPLHDDATIHSIEQYARRRVSGANSSLDVFAAAEGMEFAVEGLASVTTIAGVSALARRSVAASRVVIVSDRDEDAQNVHQALIEDDLVITHVREGDGALERISSSRPDLIVLSSQLKDGAATRLIEPMRQNAGRPELPVIVLTDLETRLDQLSAEFNFTDYLVNPFSPPMLRSRVRAWLARAVAAQGEAGAPALPARAPAEIQPLGLDRYMAQLRSVPVFRSLSESQLQGMLVSATEHVYAVGTTVIRQGELHRSVYALLSGRVRVVESVPNSPVEMFVGELGPGEVFGELGVFTDRARSASVVTLEKTHCLRIPEDKFVETVMHSAPTSLQLLKVLAGRLYDADRLLARHVPDPLTGLTSRRSFSELYRRIAASARRRKTGLMLLALDVCRLRDVNTRFGYSVGDEVLKTVSDALLESCRTTDVVCRYGSDEFALLLLDAKACDADVILNRVQSKLNDLADSRGLPVKIRCSIGYAVSQNPSEDVEELLRAADQAMQGKKQLEQARP
jgi:diguanylate cyclase (GGDEF)-like protein